jgi:D-aminoacyl-tRNA deacylase
MRAVVQRVLSASVEVEGEVVGSIDRGLLAYLGFGKGDSDEDRAWVLAKIVGLRVFEEGGKMSRGLAEIGGALLLVSQFTLYGRRR